MGVLIVIVLILCVIGFMVDRTLTNNDIIGLKAENKSLRIENGRLKEKIEHNKEKAESKKTNLKTIRKEYEKLLHANKHANKRHLEKMINDIDLELKSLDGCVVGSIEHFRRQALRDIKKYLLEVQECELKKQ